MANLPFQSSASEVMTAPALDSGVWPLNKGTREATESSALVKTNHGNPPFCTCAKMSLPLANSTAMAATNPVIASRPLIRSGAGPLKANTSKKSVLTCTNMTNQSETIDHIPYMSTLFFLSKKNTLGLGGIGVGEGVGGAMAGSLVSSFC